MRARVCSAWRAQATFRSSSLVLISSTDTGGALDSSARRALRSRLTRNQLALNLTHPQPFSYPAIRTRCSLNCCSELARRTGCTQWAGIRSSKTSRLAAGTERLAGNRVRVFSSYTRQAKCGFLQGLLVSIWTGIAFTRLSGIGKATSAAWLTAQSLIRGKSSWGTRLTSERS